MIALVLGWLVLLVVVLVVLIRREPRPTALTPDEELDAIGAYYGARRKPGESHDDFRRRLERDLA